MKNIFKLFLLSGVIILAASCAEKDDKLTYEGEVIPHFTKTSGEYVVGANATAFDVEVGTTTSAAATVNVKISESSTAIEGVHFETIAKSVSIGQGEFVGTLSIVPIFDNLDAVYYLDLEVDGSPVAEGVSMNQTYSLKLSRFCDLVITEWNGDISGVDNGGYGHTGTVVQGTDNQIILKADASGNPTLLTTLFAGWGETFQAGFGNEGDIVIDLNEDGTLVIPDQYFGQTLPGPWDYWVNGTGKYDQCTLTLTLNYNVYDVDGFADPWFGFTAVLAVQ